MRHRGFHTLVLSFACVALAGGDCSSEPQPLSLSLQLVTRQSCGALSGLDFDTTCLAAVHVRVLDRSRTPLVEKCQLVSERPDDLRELLRGAPLLALEGLRAEGVVSFEVRGLHDAGSISDASDACARPARTDAWLFWGESKPIDLEEIAGDADVSPVVPVVIDCRDCTFTCGDRVCTGCGGFSDACTPDLPPSFCVPGTRCDKSCGEDADCFEGQGRCVEGACAALAGSDGMCAPCGPAGRPCDEGFTCVVRPGQPSFCASPCPPDPCPAGMQCTRLGNDLEAVE